MNPSKTRRQIAWLAAQLMYERSESEYYRAKMKAARRVCQGWVKPKDLPSNAEIRDEIQKFSRILEGDSRTDNLRKMRFRALDVMRQRKRQTQTELISETLEDEHAHTDIQAKSWMLRRLIAPHLLSLSPDMRKAIRLYTVKGMNSREISEHMKVSVNTVKSWLRRGLAKLQNDLKIDTLEEIL